MAFYRLAFFDSSNRTVATSDFECDSDADAIEAALETGDPRKMELRIGARLVMCIEAVDLTVEPESDHWTGGEGSHQLLPPYFSIIDDRQSPP